MTDPRINSDPLLVVVVGPTASGKTALSLELVKNLDGEIISCDSVAVYREFEIGTAKPSREQRASVPHHMIDVISPQESCTAGEYARLARTALDQIKQRRRVPIVVGGTGLYLRALTEGLFPGPQRSEELRSRLHGRASSKPQGYLRRLLLRIDPVAAESIHANDTPKLIRAIEICLASRDKMSEMWKLGRDHLTGFRIVQVGLDPPREQLYQRINARCEAMFASGLVEETRELLTKYTETLAIPNSPLNSLGYRQAVQYIRGELSMSDAIAAAQQGHRNYAKRQLTWFRKIASVQWLQSFGDEGGMPSKVASLADNAPVTPDKK